MAKILFFPTHENLAHCDSCGKYVPESFVERDVEGLAPFEGFCLYDICINCGGEYVEYQLGCDGLGGKNASHV